MQILKLIHGSKWGPGLLSPGSWCSAAYWKLSLQWRHNEHDSVSNHQHYDCLLNLFIQTQIKGNIKAPRHWPLCGEFTGTDEFPAQMASYAENVSIWWRHHDAVSKHTRRHHGMEMLSALLVLWEGINQWFPSQKGTVIRSFGAFFVVSQNKQVNKHSSYRWFETPPRTYEGQLYNWVMIVANSRKSGITIGVNRYPLNSPG